MPDKLFWCKSYVLDAYIMSSKRYVISIPFHNSKWTSDSGLTWSYFFVFINSNPVRSYSTQTKRIIDYWEKLDCFWRQSSLRDDKWFFKNEKVFEQTFCHVLSSLLASFCCIFIHKLLFIFTSYFKDTRKIKKLFQSKGVKNMSN